MELVVDPVDGLVDTLPLIFTPGVAAGEPVVLTIRVTDTSGRTWQSQGQYLVGPDGALQMKDPSRPWWSMTDTSQDSVPVIFAASSTALDFTVSVEHRGDTAQRVVHRSWAAANVTVSEITGSGWLLRSYARPADGPQPAILYVPGSLGMESAAPMAALFASHGYVTGVLGYAGLAGLPAAMERIPVEVVTAGLQALAGLPSVDGDRIGVYSTSVGSPLALAALSVPESADGVPPVRAVVASSPSSVVWQALAEGGRPPKESSLTRDGADLMWLPMRDTAVLWQMVSNIVRKTLSRRPVSTALRLHDVYAKGLSDTQRAQAAAIPVELIPAPLLVLAGQDDLMWASATMAEAIIDRRRRHGRTDDQLMLLQAAGHFLRTPIIPTTVDRTAELVSGGTPPGEAAAEQRAWNATLAFYAERLG